MTSPAIDQQQPPTGQGVDISEIVVEDIRDRAGMGESKYKQRLHPINGRNMLVDLYQELLDAAQYIRGQIEEDYYWKRRCKAAEQVILLCTMEHEYAEQTDAFAAWNEMKRLWEEQFTAEGE